MYTSPGVTINPEALNVPLIETPRLLLRNLSAGPGRTAESVLSDPDIIERHQATADFVTNYWATRYELTPEEHEQYSSLMRRPESMLPLIDIAHKWRTYEQKLRETDNNLPLSERISLVQDISRSIETFFRPIETDSPNEHLVMMNHYYFVNNYCGLAETIQERTRSDTSKIWDVVMRPEVMDNYFDTDGTQYVTLPTQLSDGGNYWTVERAGSLLVANTMNWLTKGYGRLGVVEKATDQMIGLVGINTFDWLTEVTGDDPEPTEISFRLHPDWHNRGLGTEAGRAAVEWFFMVRGGFDYLYGNAVKGNEPSIRTLAKIGMHQIVDAPYARPRTRRPEKGEEVSTEFIVHGMSREEWEASRLNSEPAILSIH